MNTQPELIGKFKSHYGSEPAVVACAPGRVEMLGNHTDYNDGFVLSAATDLATCFAASPVKGTMCRLVAGDVMQEARIDSASPARSSEYPWSNYVIGVTAGLKAHAGAASGFNGMFLSNLPLAAGLSSSAALEISAALALSALYQVDLPKLELAKIAQKAEHDFAGVKCGLQDQITSLSGKEDSLVFCDFRTLAVKNVPLDRKVCLVVCNTGIKHTLVESEYNERRQSCEAAASFFASATGHPVAALRDVTWDDWERYSPLMPAIPAKRAAHVIGENGRVMKSTDLLASRRLAEFGELMYQSHESSRVYFENSCPELDFIVDTARSMPEAIGARLSGGGFGGCAVALVEKSAAAKTAAGIADAYQKRFERPCQTSIVRPSAGARMV